MNGQLARKIRQYCDRHMKSTKYQALQCFCDNYKSWWKKAEKDKSLLKRIGVVSISINIAILLSLLYKVFYS